jgi:uncharacterized protein YndB with AHSA1/START domain
MVFRILLALSLVLLALAIYLAATTPKIVKISRSQLIQSSPDKLFRYINNTRMIQEWNPFIDGDRDVKINYGGPAEGTNAQWSWEGAKAGAGEATIVASDPDKRVSLRLDFKKPFHVTNYGEYALVKQGTATEVTWTINESALIPRVMSRFMNLERMIGEHFERGLAKLKVLAESSN